MIPVWYFWVFYDMKKNLDETYYLLKELEEVGTQSQRSLAQKMGMSLGKMNFLLKSLVEKGVIKAENFAGSKHKMQYRYILTPSGIKHKIEITKAFIKRKETEYIKIQKELEEARQNALST